MSTCSFKRAKVCGCGSKLITLPCGTAREKAKLRTPMFAPFRLREMTFRGESLEAIRKAALGGGQLQPLMLDGSRKVLQGVTTVSEVLRVAGGNTPLAQGA